MTPRKSAARRRVSARTRSPPGCVPHAKTPPATLDRSVWLDAADDAIAAGGFGEARVLTLAKRLGVTRGSFYWRFRDHDDFIRAVLERWRDGQITAIDTWQARTTDAEANLRRVVHLLLTGMARDGRALRIELAMHDFARRNPLAAAITTEVNRARMRQGQALFAALTGDAERARALTLLLYACVTGARLMLAASPERAKADALAERLDRIIGDAIVAPNGGRHEAPRASRTGRDAGANR